MYMYKQVKLRKRMTEKMLDQAFAPLIDFLDKEHPDKKREILGRMMFMDNVNDRFYYKNSLTRSYIEFDQSGKLVSCYDGALTYKLDNEDEGEHMENKVPFEERFIHPNVVRWVNQNLKGKAKSVFKETVCLFLQELWGPLVNFNFEDLRVGYPLRTMTKVRTVYLTSPNLLDDIAFQFIGDDIATRSCSLKQFEQYDRLVRELQYAGWRVFSFTLDHTPTQFIDRLRLFLSKEIIYFDEDTEFVVNHINIES